MNPEDDTPATKDPETDMPASAPESAAEGGQDVSAPPTAENTTEATVPVPDAADGAAAPTPETDGPEPDAPIPDDPPVDDRVAKGKGDKARAATLGQVAAPKPKPVKDIPVPEIAPDEQVIRTRAFPGPLLAFGGRARRQGWAPGYELTAQNASDRTGRNMKLMTTGSRAGPVEWKPQHLADELVADDWEVIIPSDQLTTFLAIQNGDAHPSSEAGPA
jgi:hypothetical protein